LPDATMHDATEEELLDAWSSEHDIDGNPYRDFDMPRPIEQRAKTKMRIEVDGALARVGRVSALAKELPELLGSVECRQWIGLESFAPVPLFERLELVPRPGEKPLKVRLGDRGHEVPRAS
jgi:hypothetical protein